MEKYLLNKTDFDMINKILSISLSINKLYNELYQMEIEGKSQSEDFSKLLDYLSISIDVEKELYDNANLNYSKCEAWLIHLLQERVPSDIKSDTESILYQDTANNLVRRMASILSDKLIYDYNNIHSTELMISIIPQNEIFQSLFDNPSYVNSLAIFQRDIEYGMFNYYLSFLNDYIHDANYQYCINNMILSKYNTSFIRPKIEKKLLENRFSINSNAHNLIQFMNDFRNKKNVIYSTLKDISSFDLAKEQILALLNLTDNDYKNIDIATTSVFHQCMLRASCMLLDDDFINDLIYIFEAFKNENNNHHAISGNIIKKCFKGIKKDKNKCKILN